MLPCYRGHKDGSETTKKRNNEIQSNIRHKFEQLKKWKQGTPKNRIQVGSGTNMRSNKKQWGFEPHIKNHDEYWLGGFFLTQRLALNGKTQGRLL
jgi:hypothetical protein